MISKPSILQVPVHEHKPLEFPEGFLWGAATSSHQVEGQNSNNDWWAWEEAVQPLEKRSGLAADQYHHYEEDFALAQSLSHNTHRLSIEWSRIEPQEGQFDQEALDHYVRVLKSLKDKKMVVMLTLHHFTNPIWFSQKGGWLNSKAPFYFERFVQKVTPILAPFVDHWVTINEPGVLVFMCYIAGIWPPQRTSKIDGVRVFFNLAKAHQKAYRTIHQFQPNASVGIAHNVASFDPIHHHSVLEGVVTWGLDILNNHLFFLLSGGMGKHDFLGLNYYFNRYISFDGKHKWPSFFDISSTKKDVSDLGWEIYPEGIFDVLMDFSSFKKPIYITENGLASINDDRRCRFLVAYLKEIYHAISFGVDVKGYYHWSLIDNFEWAEGFSPRFGLVEVDFKTQQRVPRPSAILYQEIIEHNGLTHDMLRFIGHTVSVEEIFKRHKD